MKTEYTFVVYRVNLEGNDKSTTEILFATSNEQIALNYIAKNDIDNSAYYKWLREARAFNPLLGTFYPASLSSEKLKEYMEARKAFEAINGLCPMIKLIDYYHEYEKVEIVNHG